MMILLDSDHCTALFNDRHASHEDLVARLEESPDEKAITVVSIEEQLRGWLALINRQRNPLDQVLPYERLVRLLTVLCRWEIAPWNAVAAKRVTALRKSRLRVGTQDLNIAAIALEQDALLLSANLVDFAQVPDCLWRTG